MDDFREQFGRPLNRTSDQRIEYGFFKNYKPGLSFISFIELFLLRDLRVRLGELCVEVGRIMVKTGVSQRAQRKTLSLLRISSCDFLTICC